MRRHAGEGRESEENEERTNHRDAVPHRKEGHAAGGRSTLGAEGGGHVQSPLGSPARPVGPSRRPAAKKARRASGTSHCTGSRQCPEGPYLAPDEHAACQNPGSGARPREKARRGATLDTGRRGWDSFGVQSEPVQSCLQDVPSWGAVARDAPDRHRALGQTSEAAAAAQEQADAASTRAVHEMHRRANSQGTKARGRGSHKSKWRIYVAVSPPSSPRQAGLPQPNQGERP
mmetsp:Transcript_65113/g.173063  ORF Transcript_65113/g.173063 Transcript_65113/m.173063 type:complete len:231 (+) Transcript_65113:193-885(+)